MQPFLNHEIQSDLVGKTVKLKVTTQSVKVADELYEVKNYEIDDPVMEAELTTKFPGCRRHLPGTAHTADWQPFRVNVEIDEHGVITRVYRG